MEKGQVAIYTEKVMFGVNKLKCVITEIYDNDNVKILVKESSDKKLKEEIVSDYLVSPLFVGGEPVMAQKCKKHWWSREEYML